MYGKKSQLEEELDRLREKKARINAEQQAKHVALNPPIKNEPYLKKPHFSDQREDYDSDARYSDDDNYLRNKPRVKAKPPHGGGAGDSNYKSKSSPQVRMKSRSSSRENDRIMTKEERKEAEFGWKNTETLGSVPPNDYTITTITQNYDLLVYFRTILH